MDGNEVDQRQTPAADQPIEINDWASAFAALEEKKEEAPQGTSDNDGDTGSGNGTDAAKPSGEDAATTDGGDSAISEGADGGRADDAEHDAQEGDDSQSDNVGVTQEYIESYRASISESIKERTINDVAAEFVKRGIRNQNGKIGATINDSDICKYDEDKVPHFFNPDTGREFTGDNPRRQAQEWVDDYNKSVAEAFNKACAKYEDHLMQQEAPQIAVLEFSPKYDQLDPIRQGMLDSLLEDYEIKDSSGDVVGYSCDLDAALAMVNRQVAMIQQYAHANAPSGSSASPASSGPALDIKSTSGAVAPTQSKTPESLEEAMLALQNKELEKIKNR